MRLYTLARVAIQAGTYRLGPDDGTLSVRTRRTGAAARAGHNLLFHVTAWEAALEIAPEPADWRAELSVDGGSLRVREGSGGVQSLGCDDVRSIEKTVDDDVLKRQPIVFRSSRVEQDGNGLRVHGDLTLLGATRPLAFTVTVGDDGALRAEAVVKQTDFGMKPYSTLFGALKVVDEVAIAIDARLSPGAQSR
jgi:polyisoprenoid-binding protein YceI